ncbi:hypothetical protein [Nitrosopumilus ureiphilus]|uniref:Uncharacterized protein n=1 Tax=Nitrosopumilus ureiphilus TaxID=1470067 RepID=A0A7D5R5Y0_9ARCH|nr:hypothetical protein [Nitrosopumilus ureiphilus]QLH06517.1 hypothetical protein C5F50_05095 [Nitrosopumilus ureiphilus]
MQNEILDHQPLYVWNNFTHHLDNNICKWQTTEKYESDASLRTALARCWTGNSEFLTEDFTLWNNETHYIDTNTCLITEAIHSESESVKIKVCRGEYDPEWCGEGANP